MTGEAHVVVLGAGVTGLATAVLLAESDYQVTVIAAHVPGDSSIEYASPWAGAHWRTHATPQTPAQCDWDLQTYDYWLQLVQREEEDSSLPRSGVKMYESREYWDGEVQEDLWWAPHVRNFRQLSTPEAPIWSLNDNMPSGIPKIKHGVAYTAMCIDVPQYLRYLQDRARSKGVRIVNARLSTDSGLHNALDQAEQIAIANGRGTIDCFVNATGLGAVKLCGDEAMFPVKGHTVLVKGEAHTTGSRFGSDETMGYYIPRPGSGTTILGGLREKGNWSEVPDPAVTAQILKRCSYMVPELLTAPDGGFEVLSVQCGLRPARDGGPRMEREMVGGRKVVHAYGHAGAGYQNSVGSARAVVKMVGESLVLLGVSLRL